MKNVSGVIRSDKEYVTASETMRDALASKTLLPVVVNGLFGGAMDAFLCESVKDAHALTHSPSLILVPDEEQRQKVTRVLTSLGVSCLEYKERDFVFHNISASHDTERERLYVLDTIATGTPLAIVTTPKAAFSLTMPRDVLEGHSRRIAVADEIDTYELSHFLTELGYTRVDLVEAAGQFASRGDITDIWTGGEEYPVRIEFFGDEIDRMTHFDPITQRSVDNINDIRILPAYEVIISETAKIQILKEIDKLTAACEDKETFDSLKRERAALTDGHTLGSRDRYISLCYKERATLFSYIGSGSAVFITDTNGVAEAIKRDTGIAMSNKNALISKGLITLKNASYSISEAEYEKFLSENFVVNIHPFSGGQSGRSLGGLFGFKTRKTVGYGENPTMLYEDLRNYVASGYRVLLLCETQAAVRSLTDSLFDEGIRATPLCDKDDFDLATAPCGQIYIDVSELDGFELIAPKIAVLSMWRDEGRRIMENRRRQRILRKAGGAGERLMSYADLEVGDYVVHANYGIGLFEGIESVRVDGIIKDFITIRYAGTDKLFVPCDRLEYIGKYIGGRDKDGTVKLSKMGTAEWSRTKSKTKSAVRDIAKDLIKLYAERQRTPGFAFPEDSEMEDEFDAAFEYELTDSQATAVEEIKNDMKKPVPMNRLLCGDVGFGKTEVALRAAFKAIMGGKQVAILVPTTILAMQHYRTAVQRMRTYPVTIEMLSRFKSPREQARILERVKKGSVDILIGTHKMLSKNVDFRDLGLLIIDEEQRFGVAQKEKLKSVAKNIDVLTLSATPIPRTLNMAMNGVSDMSILDEAPGERKPVQTYVMEHNDAVIEDAIRKELTRGGQVLYLHNNTGNISFVADMIMRRIPEARVAYAHGQMEKDDLEDTWDMLVKEEIDVLVCTTIIETGIDLPNANTLIIEDADHMGLAQLHQLRGRVGRSSRQAYAYFTYREGKALSEIATKRLSAIRDYAEFGAGFKVALRDLEIRGAGNLLGAEQHGYIDGVGYDLYVKLLSEAVLEEEGKTKEPKIESTVDIKLDANIPERYIKTSAGRMEMYKKISLIDGREDLCEIVDELTDRYGDIPFETTNLLDVALCRALLNKAGIRKLSQNGASIIFSGDARPDVSLWSEVVHKYPSLLFRGGTKTEISYRLSPSEKAVPTACKILEEYLLVKG